MPVDMLKSRGVQRFFCKGTQPLLWAGSRAKIKEITASGIPISLNSYKFYKIQNSQICPWAATNTW